MAYHIASATIYIKIRSIYPGIHTWSTLVVHECIFLFDFCALLFYIVPIINNSRNPDLGSQRRLFSLLQHNGSCLAFISREGINPFSLVDSHRYESVFVCFSHQPSHQDFREKKNDHGETRFQQRANCVNEGWHKTGVPGTAQKESCGTGETWSYTSYQVLPLRMYCWALTLLLDSSTAVVDNTEVIIIVSLIWSRS